jgi:hypothetical protein
LAALLGVALGEPWPSVPPSVWSATAAEAARAFGVTLPVSLDVLVLPDPRLVALLLSELRGRLVLRSGQLYVQPSVSLAGCAWLSALPGWSANGVHVNP